jgi:hypothetical protein
MGGPVYNYDAALVSETKFPAYYDNHWFPTSGATPGSATWPWTPAATSSR